MTIKIDRILVPIDFSAGSSKAKEYADQIARVWAYLHHHEVLVDEGKLVAQDHSDHRAPFNNGNAHRVRGPRPHGGRLDPRMRGQARRHGGCVNGEDPLA